MREFLPLLRSSSGEGVDGAILNLFCRVNGGDIQKQLNNYSAGRFATMRGFLGTLMLGCDADDSRCVGGGANPSLRAPGGECEHKRNGFGAMRVQRN